MTISNRVRVKNVSVLSDRRYRLNEVEFEYRAIRPVSIVNHINRRATILVESADGQPYRNGKKYHKFYIPLTMLKPAAKSG